MKNYHHLTLIERERLSVMQATGLSLREIAKQLGRSHTSLSRELRRNRTGKGRKSRELLTFQYVPCRAQEKAAKRKIVQRTKAPLKCPEIFLYVRVHLRAPYYWSPEEIGGRLSLDHPELSIDDETIYRFYGKKQRWMKLWVYLKLHRKRRLKVNGRKGKQGRLPTALPIEQRPEKANRRAEGGHWETDNVGTIKTDKTGISASTERKSRVFRLRKLQDRTAQTKRQILIAQIKKEAPRMQKTLTIDRGSENSEHELFSKQTQMPVYACNPYHSWEKGTVENSIGRLRFFIPKKSSVDQLTQKELSRIENIMNNTPRKILGYLTPNEVYEKILTDPHTS